jgi:hypothetical protein
MKRKFLILLFIAVSFIQSGCIKDILSGPQDEKPRELPPLTHDGLNVFGCYVNGELMTGKNIYISFNHIRPEMNDSLSMSIELEDKQAKFHIRIDINNKIKGPGKYSLARMYSYGNHNGWDDKYVTTILQNRKDEAIAFQCNADMYGELNIMSYDVQTQKMSGTFEFDAVYKWSWDTTLNAHNLDTVRVRQGRFDYER